MRRLYLCLGVVLAALQPSGAWPQEPTQVTPSALSPLATTPQRTTLQQDLAAVNPREWGLTREEWARYRQLMRGPLGIYSPNLDPLTVLGTEARSDTERRHIAELQVRMEAQRVQKLFAYQRAYDAAWKRIYPALPSFRESAEVSSPSPLSATSFIGATAAGAAAARLAVFVKDDCPACDREVKDLEESGQAFDLYMVGTRGDDARIRTWAMRLKIDPAKVRAGTITLNHDAGRWLSLALPGSLPAVLHSVGGQWRRE